MGRPQQQMQPGQQQRKVVMAGAHGVPVSQQWCEWISFSRVELVPSKRDRKEKKELTFRSSLVVFLLLDQ